MNKTRRRKNLTRTSHCYSADRPIKSKKNDALNRTKFAERLANDLISWDGKDSLVVALYGAWGSGKSSVKNMVLEVLAKMRKCPIPVLEFNPWQLSGTGGIPTNFFRELVVILGEEGPSPDVEKRAASLNHYAGLLNITGNFAKSIGILRQFLNKADGSIFNAAGHGLTVAAEVAKSGSEALIAKEDLEKKGIHQLKDDLSALMSKLPRPVLVVIDDIDRLSHDEILQIFQLVKANADFPNLVFLLLFERSIVAKALNTISDDRGDEFLEKIVQVGFHIPHASRKAVSDALFTGLEFHLGFEGVSKNWDRHRWSNLFSDGVESYFRNLRHVKRFLASFAFHVREHRNGKSFEVNPVDLIGLETLRVFEPTVYERLPGLKTILTRYEGPGLFTAIKQTTVDQVLSQVIAASSLENQTKVREILVFLFPCVTPAYSEINEVSRHHDEWLRQLRVCHPDLFEKYFSLTVGEDDLSQADLDNLLSLAPNVEGFITACEALKARKLLILAFERLDAYRKHIPVGAMPALVQALCNLSDNFPEPQSESLLGHGPLTYAWRLCYFGLKQEPDLKRRINVINDAITRSSGIFLPFELVSSDERVGDREKQGFEFLLEEPDVEALKKVCIQKFRDIIEHWPVRRNKHIRNCFMFWSSWDSASEVKSRIRKKINSPQDALGLITLLLSEKHSYGQAHKIQYSISLGLLERFIEVEHLSKLLRQLNDEKITKMEVIAIREFNKALKRRTEGKPDTLGLGFHDSDEEVVE